MTSRHLVLLFGGDFRIWISFFRSQTSQELKAQPPSAQAINPPPAEELGSLSGGSAELFGVYEAGWRLLDHDLCFPLGMIDHPNGLFLDFSEG